jgi:hypothetical protein
MSFSSGALRGASGDDRDDEADDATLVSRRRFLQGTGAAGVVASAPWLWPGAASAAVASTGPTVLKQALIAGAPPPEQLHLQFGEDAASQMSASWATPVRVNRPRLRLGKPGHGYGTEIDAIERVYTEALTGQTVSTYHARMDGLEADSDYIYQVHQRGADPLAGQFRTGPDGRSRKFRFTSFGDQSVPMPIGLGLGPWSPNAGFVVDAVEAANPLFHLLNGDLCYANVSDAPVETWQSFFNNNMRSARNRPWMPCPGNHENEVGNGPQGYLPYQTRFDLPGNGGDPAFAGNWYAFTVGAIRIVSINNDDVCLQDGAFSTYRRDHIPGYAAEGLNPYIRGYSGGAQKQWLEQILHDAREDAGIDWIVVCMHQVAMSSAHFNGADLGIRQEWLPLFDRYGVDLVVAGHEHHFERTFPVKGVVPGSSVLTPATRGTDAASIDTTAGCCHMIIGGGGHSGFTPPSAFDTPHDGVLIAGVGPGSPQAQHPTIVVTEPAAWSAYRDVTTPYGFATFDVDPAAANGMTTITVTHYGAQKGSSVYAPVDTCVLRRPSRRLAGGSDRGLAAAARGAR